MPEDDELLETREPPRNQLVRETSIFLSLVSFSFLSFLRTEGTLATAGAIVQNGRVPNRIWC